MKSCPSHCETAATRQSPRKLRRKRIRKTLRLEPLKTMKSCPSHCETSATRQSLRKLRRERIRKGRAPAGFASKPLRNCNLKNLETLLLEPLKTMNNEIVPQPLRNCSHQAKPKKAASGAHPEKAEPQQVLRPSHCRSACSLKNLETLLLEPLKTMKSSPIKTMKTCLSHCVAFGTPKNTQAIRKHSQKNADALLLEPTKKNKESIPKPLRNFSHQAKPKKKVIDLRNQRRTTNEIVPQPLRNFSHQAKPKKAASGAHPKRQSPSRFCVQAIAELQPQKSRNVAFGTPTNNEQWNRAPATAKLQPPGKAQESCVGSASEKAEPQQVLRPSHCRSAASKISKRCFWNP